MAPIRLAIDAVIEHHGAILLVKYEDVQFGRHFGLPGGGVEPNESIHEAVRREVHEETGAEVVVGPLLLVNEYQPERYSYLYSDEHELRLVFHCTLREGSQLESPSKPDIDQIGVGWLPLEQLPHAPLFPKIGARLFALLTAASGPDPFNTEL